MYFVGTNGILIQCYQNVAHSKFPKYACLTVELKNYRISLMKNLDTNTSHEKSKQ